MINRTIANFTIQHLIDSGGMADVYYAENNLGKPAAIKVLKKKFSDEEVIHERFTSEAWVMVSLDHPNIIKVLDKGEVEGQPAIIMEYLHGTTLKEKIEQKSKIPDEKLQKYFRQCVSALTYTKKHGIVHRDIKPSNIFITDDDNVKILDFGIAKSQEGISHTLTGQTLGTIIYMSPEQVKDPKRVTYKSDIYSLGISFVHALTRKKPYDISTSSEFVVQKMIVDENIDIAKLPPQWQGILSKCLEKDPELRAEPEELKFEGNETYNNDVNQSDDITIPLVVNEPKKTESKNKIVTNKFNFKYLFIALGAAALLILVYMFLLNSGNNPEPQKTEIKLFKDKNTGLYGFKAGDSIIISAKFKQAEEFKEGRAKVSVQDSVYFIDLLGNIVELIKPGNSEKSGDQKKGDAKKEKSVNQEEVDWQETISKNTVNAYQIYISKYPAGKYVSDAKKRIKELQSNTTNTKEAQQKAISEIRNSMVNIPGGSFMMGCTAEQGFDCGEEEKPAHIVNVKKFFIGKYEVTQSQWNAIMGENKATSCDNCPVEGVSWNQVQEFIRKLNSLSGENYKLPTEEQWEYAARGGGDNTKYSGGNEIESVGWFMSNSGNKVHPFGSKKANGFKLYDMSGNVSEFTATVGKSYAGSKVNFGNGQSYVLRGGSVKYSAKDCRVSSRSLTGSGTGFRLVK